jgi:4-hydroxy-3-methylbut-2-enyl diphosphate reductase
MYLVESVDDVAQLEVKHPNQLAYVTQTTLSIDDAAEIVAALQQRFPNITAPKSDSICYATQNRQDAIKTLAQQCEVVIVVGSPNSSNSNRLREVAELQGAQAYMVDNASYLKTAWVQGKQTIGVSAGASAPEVLVKEVISSLQKMTQADVIELPGVEEKVVFHLPKNLRDA